VMATVMMAIMVYISPVVTITLITVTVAMPWAVTV